MKGSSELPKVLTFLETLSSISSGRSIIFLLDFFNPHVGFLGFELRVTIVAGELSALATGVVFI